MPKCCALYTTSTQSPPTLNKYSPKEAEEDKGRPAKRGVYTRRIYTKPKRMKSRPMTTKNRVSNAAHVLLTHRVTTHVHRPTVDEQTAVKSATSCEMSISAEKQAWRRSLRPGLLCPFACARARVITRSARACRAWTVKPVKFDGKATVGIASGQPAEDGDP